MLAQLAFFTKAAATVYLVREYVAELTLCMGPSMLPTLNTSGDIVLVEHVTARTGRLQVGDVVIARSVQNPKHIVCKRIRGLEGDLVEIQGSSYLPDRIVKVRFRICVTQFNLGLLFQKKSQQSYLQVPKGHVWLQGDNMAASYDSRHYGPVPLGCVRGRALMRIWPLSEAGWIKELKTVN